MADNSNQLAAFIHHRVTAHPVLVHAQQCILDVHIRCNGQRVAGHAFSNKHGSGLLLGQFEWVTMIVHKARQKW